MRPAKLDWVRNEITRMRSQLRAQEREIRMLQRAGAPTASAELLLSRMRAKVDHLCERARGAAQMPSFRAVLANEKADGTSTRQSQLSCINVSKEEDDDGYGKA